MDFNEKLNEMNYIEEIEEFKSNLDVKPLGWEPVRVDRVIADKDFKRSDINLINFGNILVPIVIDDNRGLVVQVVSNLRNVMKEATGKEVAEVFDKHKKPFPNIQPDFRKLESASVVKMKDGRYVTMKNNGEIIE